LDEDFDDSQPPSAHMELVALAKEGIRLVLKDREAVPKSPEQLEAIVTGLECREDVSVILPTGGGKSMIWQALAMVEPDGASIIIEPLKLLLEEQLQSSKDKGIVAAKYEAGVAVPEDIQNLFVQLETFPSVSFRQ
jgi:superfamily II DNA helicase RecQ